MKTIGIIGGMAFESSLTYYQVINECVNKALGDHHSARCIMYSVDFQDIIETHRSGDWDRAAEILSDAGLRLKAAGADFLILATNTMHIVAPQVQEATGLPLLHIAELTADRLIADGIETVGLLGTTFTMEMDFYKQRLIDRGLEVLIPDKAGRDEVFRIIDNELAFGDIRPESLAIYQAEIDKLKERGAQGVILGCTEIGLLVQQESSSLPVYDTALIHAEETARRALVRYKAAIFDMDGTILSTIEDLSDSVNYAMRECGHKCDFSYQETRQLFGSGIVTALRRALAVELGAPASEYMKLGNDESTIPPEYMPADEDVQAVREVFSEYYPDHCAIKTGPYPGIHKLLDTLLEAGVKTAVVSNKIDPAVQELVKVHFPGKFSAALGEGAPLRRKPYPDMVDKIMADLGVSPEEAVYIGDSEVDVETAAASGLDCICVDWGFRDREFIKAHGGEVFVSEAMEIAKIIIG